METGEAGRRGGTRKRAFLWMRWSLRVADIGLVKVLLFHYKWSNCLRYDAFACAQQETFVNGLGDTFSFHCK